MTGWIVYILECADGSLYTGITNDLEKRLQSHAAGTGAKYTRGRGPFKMLFSEKFASRSAATVRERQIKALRRVEKIALCESSFKKKD